MNTKLIKGYLISVLAGLVILAVVVLVILQWGNTANFSLYGKNIPDANTAVVVIASAVAGILMVYIIRAFVYGVVALRTGHRQQEAQRTSERLADLEKGRAEAERTQQTPRHSPGDTPPGQVDQPPSQP